ncbi:MAG: hypothetical protein J2P41_23870, partial [Blastocatellia bacterium]|nr:hypothetical protein [Blastocatellia bacterium]
GEMDFMPHFWSLLNIDSAEVSLNFHRPVEVSRQVGAKAIAHRVQGEVASAFDYGKLSAIEAARAEVPVEFAAALEQTHIIESTLSDDDRANDYIIGTLLHTLFAPKQNELNSEEDLETSEGKSF